jgi:hypothetical protein
MQSQTRVFFPLNDDWQIIRKTLQPFEAFIIIRKKVEVGENGMTDCVRCRRQTKKTFFLATKLKINFAENIFHSLNPPTILRLFRYCPCSYLTLGKSFHFSKHVCTYFLQKHVGTYFLQNIPYSTEYFAKLGLFFKTSF